MRELSPFEWALLPLKKYAVFDGRAPRAEYWWYRLAIALIGAVVGAGDITLVHRPLYGSFGPFVLASMVLFLVPSLAVLVRRLHDIGRSGWWAMLQLPSYGFVMLGHSPMHGSAVLRSLPQPFSIVALASWVVCGIALFLFLIIPGDEGANRYGPDPYGPGDLEEVFA